MELSLLGLQQKIKTKNQDGHHFELFQEFLSEKNKNFFLLSSYRCFNDICSVKIH